MNSNSTDLLEVTGEELSEAVEMIQRRGGFVQAADVLGLSSYRLSIVWPVVGDCDVPTLSNS